MYLCLTKGTDGSIQGIRSTAWGKNSYGWFLHSECASIGIYERHGPWAMVNRINLDISVYRAWSYSIEVVSWSACPGINFPAALLISLVNFCGGRIWNNEESHADLGTCSKSRLKPMLLWDGNICSIPLLRQHLKAGQRHYDRSWDGSFQPLFAMIPYSSSKKLIFVLFLASPPSEVRISTLPPLSMYFRRASN